MLGGKLGRVNELRTLPEGQRWDALIEILAGMANATQPLTHHGVAEFGRRDDTGVTSLDAPPAGLGIHVPHGTDTQVQGRLLGAHRYAKVIEEARSDNSWAYASEYNSGTGEWEYYARAQHTDERGEGASGEPFYVRFPFAALRKNSSNVGPPTGTPPRRTGEVRWSYLPAVAKNAVVRYTYDERGRPVADVPTDIQAESESINVVVCPPTIDAKGRLTYQQKKLTLKMNAGLVATAAKTVLNPFDPGVTVDVLVATPHMCGGRLCFPVKRLTLPTGTTVETLPDECVVLDDTLPPLGTSYVSWSNSCSYANKYVSTAYADEYSVTSTINISSYISSFVPSGMPMMDVNPVFSAISVESESASTNGWRILNCSSFYNASFWSESWPSEVWSLSKSTFYVLIDSESNWTSWFSSIVDVYDPTTSLVCSYRFYSYLSYECENSTSHSQGYSDSTVEDEVYTSSWCKNQSTSYATISSESSSIVGTWTDISSEVLSNWTSWGDSYSCSSWWSWYGQEDSAVHTACQPSGGVSTLMSSLSLSYSMSYSESHSTSISTFQSWSVSESLSTVWSTITGGSQISSVYTSTSTSCSRSYFSAIGSLSVHSMESVSCSTYSGGCIPDSWSCIGTLSQVTSYSRSLSTYSSTSLSTMQESSLSAWQSVSTSTDYDTSNSCSQFWSWYGQEQSSLETSCITVALPPSTSQSISTGTNAEWSSSLSTSTTSEESWSTYSALSYMASRSCVVVHGGEPLAMDAIAPPHEMQRRMDICGACEMFDGEGCRLYSPCCRKSILRSKIRTGHCARGKW